MIKKIVSLLSACALAFGTAGINAGAYEPEKFSPEMVDFNDGLDLDIPKPTLITVSAYCVNKEHSAEYDSEKYYLSTDGTLSFEARMMPSFDNIDEIGIMIRGLPNDYDGCDVEISNAKFFDEGGIKTKLNSLNKTIELTVDDDGYAYIRIRKEDLIDEKTGEVICPATPELIAQSPEESYFKDNVGISVTLDFGNTDLSWTRLAIEPQSYSSCVAGEYVYYDVYVQNRECLDDLKFTFDVKGGKVQDYILDTDNLKKLGFDDWDHMVQVIGEEEKHQFIGYDVDFNDSTDLQPNERVKVGTLIVMADGTEEEVSVTTADLKGTGRPNGYSHYYIDQEAGWTTISGSVATQPEADEKDISHYNVVLSKYSFNYDGSHHLPEFTVERGEKVLEKGTDYSVAVANNTEVGTATITVTGKGDYSGSKQVRFLITETQIPEGDPCGNNMVWSFEEETNTLWIKGFGNMYDYEAGKAPWYDLKDKIYSVEVADGVTGIGINAFRDCPDLYTINLPETLKKIGDYAFYNAQALTDITFPEKLDSLGLYALSKTLWLRDYQAYDPLVVVNGMLIDGTTCYGDVEIPDNVTKILGYAFADNTEITSVVMPSSVERIGEKAFESCIALKTADIPETVVHIYSDAFNDCSDELTILCVKGSAAERHAFDKKIKYELKTTSIEGCSIELTPNTYVFEGEPCEPATDVWLDDVHLERGTDYDVEYVNNDAAGIATVIITGKGSYSGEASIDFEITIKLPPPAIQIILADLNFDGSINVSDISMMAAHIKGKRSLEGDALTAADVSLDNVINVKDLSLVAAHVKGIKMLTNTSVEVS